MDTRLAGPGSRMLTVILGDVEGRVRGKEELAALAAEAVRAREEEKARIARELHDELAQTLTALKLDTAWVRDNLQRREQIRARLQGMLELLDLAVGATRRIPADLRPPVLDDLGLVPAVEWLAHNFEERHAIPCELEVDAALEVLDPHATALFRILQESLVNVAKHAHATRVRVRLLRQGGEVLLTVQDDGVGFVPAQAHKPASLGLVGMRERVQLLQGTLSIASAPGQGTRLEVRVLLPA
jgi:signal transduction histidine kinase